MPPKADYPIVGFKVLKAVDHGNGQLTMSSPVARKARTHETERQERRFHWTSPHQEAICTKDSSHTAPHPGCGCGLYARHFSNKERFGPEEYRRSPQIYLTVDDSGEARIARVKMHPLMVVTGEPKMITGDMGWISRIMDVIAIVNGAGLEGQSLAEYLQTEGPFQLVVNGEAFTYEVSPKQLARYNLVNLAEFQQPINATLSQMWGVSVVAEEMLASFALEQGQTYTLTDSILDEINATGQIPSWEDLAQMARILGILFATAQSDDQITQLLSLLPHIGQCIIHGPEFSR